MHQRCRRRSEARQWRGQVFAAEGFEAGEAEWKRFLVTARVTVVVGTAGGTAAVVSTQVQRFVLLTLGQKFLFDLLAFFSLLRKIYNR